MKQSKRVPIPVLVIAVYLSLLACLGVTQVQAENIVLTDTNPDTTITAGTVATVYGSSGANHVTIESGANVRLINFPGSNTITIKADSNLFTVSRSGATVRFQGSDDTVLEMPTTAAAQTIVFDDGSQILMVESGKVMFGDHEVDTTPAAITTIEVVGPEIVQLIPTDTDSISVAWLPPSIPSDSELADSGITSDSEFVYQVHAGAADNFTPSATTLKKEVSGELQAEISGLSAGTTYYLLVVAKAQSGETIPGKTCWSVKTLDAPVELNPDVPLINSEDAGLGTAEISGDQYTFEKSGDEEIPATGSLLVVDSATGSPDDSGDGSGGYLRKVESVTDSGGQIVVQTSQGVLSEAVTSGSISNTVQLFSPESSDAIQKTRIGLHKGYKLTRSTSTDGTPTTRMEWNDKLLTVEETISPDFVPSDRKGYRSIELLKSGTTNKLTLEANLTFEPRIKTEAEWHTEWLKPVIESGEVIAIGTFRADMSARYQFSSAYNWGTADSPKEEKLWERKWRSVYTAGGVPVYQEITLTLTAQAWAKASAAIDAKALAFAETEIQVGVRYNSSSGKWEPVTGIDFDRGFTATLNVQGTVEGEVRLVPNVKVEFYEVVGANLSVEPYSHGLIKYVLDSSYSGPTISQFTNFDYYLGLDCNMNVTLWPIFDDEDPLYSAQLYSNTWSLFDLPELDITSTKNGNCYNLQADVEDGTNNEFKESSIQWEVYDPYGNRTSLSNGQYDGSTTAEFIPETDGTHIIILSGYGKLGDWMGEAGRQYTTKEIEASTTGSVDLTGTYTALRTIIQEGSCTINGTNESSIEYTVEIEANDNGFSFSIGNGVLLNAEYIDNDFSNANITISIEVSCSSIQEFHQSTTTASITDDKIVTINEYLITWCDYGCIFRESWTLTPKEKNRINNKDNRHESDSSLCIDSNCL